MAVLMVASACGGDDSGGGATGGSEATDFPPPALTSAEVCERIGTNDVVALFGGTTAAVTPSDARTGCWYSVADGEDSVGETTITLLHGGGRDGYDAEVQRWTRIGTVTEIPDFAGVNYDGDAILVETSSGPPRVVMFLGGASVWEVTIGVHPDDVAMVERIARTVASQV